MKILYSLIILFIASFSLRAQNLTPDINKTGTTVDASTVTLVTLPPVPVGKSMMVLCHMTAVSGTAYKSMIRTVLYYNNGGVVTMIGSVQTVTADQSTGSVLNLASYTLGLTGTTPTVLCTGALTTTIIWRAAVSYKIL